MSLVFLWTRQYRWKLADRAKVYYTSFSSCRDRKVFGGRLSDQFDKVCRIPWHARYKEMNNECTRRINESADILFSHACVSSLASSLILFIHIYIKRFIYFTFDFSVAEKPKTFRQLDVPVYGSWYWSGKTLLLHLLADSIRSLRFFFLEFRRPWHKYVKFNSS